MVTGSYIRRTEGFIQASSVTQIDAQDLADEGTLNIGEVIQNLSFVNGSAATITNTIQDGGFIQDSFNTEIDLRGLGERSTLTLLDGKRLARENVNSLIPTIAIQRVDIVTDGSAALYGNEAVAGVVNFVPYTSYDGLKVDGYVEQDSRGDYDEHSVQFLWGGDVGDVDMVVAGQFRSNSRLGWDERNTLANSGLTFSSNAPGNWYVPKRDESGAYVGPILEPDANGNPSVNTDNVLSDRLRTNPDADMQDQPRFLPTPGTPDPNCGDRSERTGYTPNEVANPYGFELLGSCYFDFGDTRSYREPTDTVQLFANASWDYSDDLSFSFQGFHTRLYETRYTSTSNPGESRILELPAVRGEIPGNPFRAVDADGDPLFGQDNDGDGIPDRQSGVDVNNDGWDDYIVTGTTDNGVPLYEDVVPRSLRPINKTHTQPSGHTSDMDNTGSTLDHVSRYSFQADFTVPGLDGWEGFAAYTYNYFERKLMAEQNYDIEAMKEGLRCNVVTERANCYNPFLVVDQADNNSRHVMDAIAARGYQYEENKLGLIDVVLNGEIGGFELPGGAVGMAVGYQWRDESYTNTPSPVELAGDTWIGSPGKESVTSGSREVDAFFVEFALPLLPNLELEAAMRREEFSTGQESTDPKFGLTWGVTDWLTLRATTGDAFITPTLEQLLDPEVCGLTSVTDRFGPFSAFTTACESGNPNLENETAESISYGFDIEVGDFNLSVTYNETDFENRIVTPEGQDLMAADFAAFKAATGFAGNGRDADQKPSEKQLTDWVSDPRSDERIVRDQGDLTTIRRIDGLQPGNTEEVIVEAYDIQGGYHFSTDFGDFRLNLQATHIAHFYYREAEGGPLVDGAGLYNHETGAAPELPEWKINLRANWLMGNHSVSSTVHHIDALPYDGPTYTHMDFFANTFRRPLGVRDGKVRAWTDMDIAYTYRGLTLWDGEGAFTLGARNVFDRQAQRSAEFAGVIGGLQDPLGRVIYARFVYDL